MSNLIPASLGEITRIEYQKQLVLTTAQLAEFYETNVDTVQRNFERNSDRFIEEKHMFTLRGLELRNFKRDIENLYPTNCYLQITPMTRVLYLWTKRGSTRHAKMLNTDKAWEVFELLEDTYFNPPRKPKSQRALALELRRASELRRLADRTDDENERNQLIAKAKAILAVN